MKDKKFTVRKVANGYVVKILNYGESTYREPYPDYREELVFTHLLDLQTWIGNFIAPQGDLK